MRTMSCSGRHRLSSELGCFGPDFLHQNVELFFRGDVRIEPDPGYGSVGQTAGGEVSWQARLPKIDPPRAADANAQEIAALRVKDYLANNDGFFGQVVVLGNVLGNPVVKVQIIFVITGQERWGNQFVLGEKMCGERPAAIFQDDFFDDDLYAFVEILVFRHELFPGLIGVELIGPDDTRHGFDGTVETAHPGDHAHGAGSFEDLIRIEPAEKEQPLAGFFSGQVQETANGGLPVDLGQDTLIRNELVGQFPKDERREEFLGRDDRLKRLRRDEKDPEIGGDFDWA